MTDNATLDYALHRYVSTYGNELDRLFASYGPRPYGEALEDWDAFLADDYGELWRTIASNDSVRVESIATLPLAELADLALAYGRRLIPVAYLEKVYLLRWAPTAAASDALVAFPRWDGTAVVRSARRGAIDIVCEVGNGAVVGSTASEDYRLADFAAGVPLGLVDVATRLTPAVANEAIVLTLVEALGTAEGAFVKSLSWVHQRMVFGRVLGSYQAIKHLLADVFMSLEMLRSAVDAGVHGTLTADGAERAFEYALAALEVCVQVHGGRGFAWDGGIAPRLRHLLALRTLVSGLFLEEGTQPW
jgi:hypothetical protein